MLQQERTIQQIETELIKEIETLSFIVNGLENYEPFRRLLNIFNETIIACDNNWHLIADLNKLNELRISKLAANSLVNTVSNLKDRLEKFQNELITLRNPDDIVNKDYDAN